jgi:hypothetical protein
LMNGGGTQAKKLELLSVTVTRSSRICREFDSVFYHAETEEKFYDKWSEQKFKAKKNFPIKETSFV